METPHKSEKSVMDEVFPAVKEFRLQMSQGSGHRKRTMTSESDAGNTSKRLCSSLELSFEEQLDREKEAFLYRSHLVENETTIIDLENQIKYLKTELERINIEHEMSFEKLRRKYGHDSFRVSDLEMELQQATTKNKQSVERLKDRLEEQIQKNTELERDLIELRMKRSQQEEDSEERMDLLNSEKDEACNESLHLEAQLTQLLHQIEQKEEELEEANDRKSELSTELMAAEEKICDTEALKMRVQDLENEMTQMKVDCKVGLLLKDKLGCMEEIKARNEGLRSENNFHLATADNNMMLQLQKESLESKLEKAEKELECYSQLQIEHEALKLRLAKWEKKSTDTQTPISPEELCRQITNLQSENLAMLEQQGKLQSIAKRARLQFTESAVERKTLKRQVVELQKENQSQTEVSRRANQQIDIMKKETQSLKELVKSYETSKALRMNASVLRRMREAESSCKQYEQLLQDREEEFAQLSQQLKSAQLEAHNLQVEISNTQTVQAISVDHPADVNQRLITSLREHISQSETALASALSEKSALQALLEQQKEVVSSTTPRRSSITVEDSARVRRKTEELRAHVKRLVEVISPTQSTTQEKSSTTQEECGTTQEECGTTQEECGTTQEECGTTQEECSTTPEVY